MTAGNADPARALVQCGWGVVRVHPTSAVPAPGSWGRRSGRLHHSAWIINPEQVLDDCEYAAVLGVGQWTEADAVDADSGTIDQPDDARALWAFDVDVDSPDDAPPTPVDEARRTIHEAVAAVLGGNPDATEWVHASVHVVSPGGGGHVLGLAEVADLPPASSTPIGDGITVEVRSSGLLRLAGAQHTRGGRRVAHQHPGFGAHLLPGVDVPGLGRLLDTPREVLRRLAPLTNRRGGPARARTGGPAEPRAVSNPREWAERVWAAETAALRTSTKRHDDVFDAAKAVASARQGLVDAGVSGAHLGALRDHPEVLRARLGEAVAEAPAKRGDDRRHDADLARTIADAWQVGEAKPRALLLTEGVTFDEGGHTRRRRQRRRRQRRGRR